jgi:hypothetical protein
LAKEAEESAAKDQEWCFKTCVAYSRISSVIRFEESILLRSAKSASVCGGSDCLYALAKGKIEVDDQERDR